MQQALKGHNCSYTNQEVRCYWNTNENVIRRRNFLGHIDHFRAYERNMIVLPF